MRLRQVEAHDHMHELGFHNMISDGGDGIAIDDQLIGIEPLDYQLCLDLINGCEKKGLIWAFSPDNETRRLAPDDRFYLKKQAEVNGALNIMRKSSVVGVNILYSRDEVDTPIRIRIA